MNPKKTEKRPVGSREDPAAKPATGTGTDTALHAENRGGGKPESADRAVRRRPSRGEGAASLDVLVVDDDPEFTVTVEHFLRREGYAVSVAASLREAQTRLTERHYDLVLVDLMLPDGSGMDLVEELPSTGPSVIVVTGHPSVKFAVDALRARVHDFLVKPLDVLELRRCIASVTQRRRRAVAPPHPRELGREHVAFGPLVGTSPPMQQLYEAIAKVAPSDASVLLVGETGTGKELVAQAIHELSPRRGQPFLAVNCGAVPKDLIASELFGHERGSFTGATRGHRGYFERAAGGTLFLDEITEMPLELQVNLLRVLETNRFSRIGGNRDLQAEARLVAATNRDPQDAVEAGRLREDLYFRLTVFPIRLPPLRERTGDVRLLSSYFLAVLNEQQGIRKTISDEAMQLLERLPWPGNVRELRNTLQRAFILAERHIGLKEVHRATAPLRELGSKADPIAVGTSVRKAKGEILLRTLEACGGDKRAAAERLGVSLRTVYNWLNRHQRDTNQG